MCTSRCLLVLSNVVKTRYKVQGCVYSQIMCKTITSSEYWYKFPFKALIIHNGNMKKTTQFVACSLFTQISSGVLQQHVPPTNKRLQQLVIVHIQKSSLHDSCLVFFTTCKTSCGALCIEGGTVSASKPVIQWKPAIQETK